MFRRLLHGCNLMQMSVSRTNNENDMHFRRCVDLCRDLLIDSVSHLKSESAIAVQASASSQRAPHFASQLKHRFWSTLIRKWSKSAIKCEKRRERVGKEEKWAWKSTCYDIRKMWSRQLDPTDVDSLLIQHEKNFQQMKAPFIFTQFFLRLALIIFIPLSGYMLVIVR